MKLKAYQNHLDHAILIPPPPVRESAQTQSGHRHKEGCGGWPSEVGGDASCGDADEPSTTNYLVLDEPPRARAAGGGGWGGVKERSAEVPEGWLRELGQMRQRGLVSPSISYKSAHTGYSSMSMPHVVTISHVHAVWIPFSYACALVLLFVLCMYVILARSFLKCTLPYRSDTSHSSYASHASNSVDGMVSRSSTVRIMIVEACGCGCVCVRVWTVHHKPCSWAQKLHCVRVFYATATSPSGCASSGLTRFDCSCRQGDLRRWC